MRSPGTSGAKNNKFELRKPPETRVIRALEYILRLCISLETFPSVIERVFPVPLWKTSPSGIEGAFH